MIHALVCYPDGASNAVRANDYFCIHKRISISLSKIGLYLPNRHLDVHDLHGPGADDRIAVHQI